MDIFIFSSKFKKDTSGGKQANRYAISYQLVYSGELV